MHHDSSCHLAVQEVIFKNILVIATHTYARTRTLIQKQTAQLMRQNHGLRVNGERRNKDTSLGVISNTL
jgi:hypothetical protein